MSDQKQAIDISQLPVDQVAAILRQMREESQYLDNSITQLKVVSSKFSDAIGYLGEFKPENEGKALFVPLTSSLYVPGTMCNVKTVLVDIGTGYFVEKNIPAANDYLSRRVKDLNGKIDLLQKKYDSNRKNMIQVQMVYQAKVQMQRQQGGY